MSALLDLARAELRSLPPWERAAPHGARTSLDANEVPWRPAGDRTAAGLNRYPEARARALESRLAALHGVDPARVLVTRGSDEAIDLLVRAFCRPGRDAILVLPPTFGMYARAARIQGARVVEVERARRNGFALPTARIAARLAGVKLVFVPDPDNPTGRSARPQELVALARATAGRALLVIDEAYGEFAAGSGAGALLARWPHVVLLRTLSKAHALAGARLGAALAVPEIVELLARLLPPFALAQPSLEAAAVQLAPAALSRTKRRIARLVEEREQLAGELAALDGVARVFPSGANFLLVALTDVERACRALAADGIEVRRFDDRALADCVRITVGSRAENRRLVAALERS